MDRYFVNKAAQSNGDHEVHKEGCFWLGLAHSTQDLGYHTNCQFAVAAAKVLFWQSNGCAFCAPACHTG